MPEIRIEITGDGRDGEAALRDIDQWLGRIQRSLNDTGNDSQDMGRDTQRAADQASRALQEVGDAADNAGESSSRLGEAMGSLRERASGALDGVMEHSGAAGQALSALGPYGKAAAVAIGVAMAGAALAIKGLKSAIDASMSRTADLAKQKAALGVSGADAAKFGKEAATLYMNNWGETLKDAGDTVRDAAMYIMPTPEVMNAKIAPTLQAVATRVRVLADTMDEDSTRVSQTIRQMLVTGMAKNVDEAANLIHAGVSAGVNSAGDLLDTFNEYGTQFRKMGLDGATAMGLLNQGLKAGARDSDIMADAIKEFSIRSIDGSSTTIDAFKSLGMNAKQMQQIFAKGGPAAAQGLDMVLDKLRAIKNPAEQARIATELFGTQSEDLGKALQAMDLTTAKQSLGDIAGAADKAAATLSGNSYNAVEGLRRRWEMFKADLGDKFEPTFAKVMAWLDKFANQMAPIVTKMLDDWRQRWQDNHVQIEQFVEFAKATLAVVVPWAIGTIGFAVDVLIETIKYLGVIWTGLKAVVPPVAEFFINSLYNILQAAAFAFGWIPGLGPKLKEAAKAFGEFRDKANAALEGINDKTVHVDVVTRAPQAQGQTGHASNYKIAASGGIRSDWTLIGDRGPELVKFGGGGTGYVMSNAQTRTVLGQAGGAGGPVATMSGGFRSSGASPGLESVFLGWLKELTRTGRYDPAGIDPSLAVL